MSPRILLQFTILTHLSRKYKFFSKDYHGKIINLLTFARKYAKVLNGGELQSANDIKLLPDNSVDYSRTEAL
jgi:hypothetical protein